MRIIFGVTRFVPHYGDRFLCGTFITRRQGLLETIHNHSHHGAFTHIQFAANRDKITHGPANQRHRPFGITRLPLRGGRGELITHHRNHGPSFGTGDQLQFSQSISEIQK
jgi:hypothetical protein